jgi:hypothetical protein
MLNNLNAVSNIAAGTVTAEKLATGAVSAVAIAQGAITSNKLDASVDARYVNASGDTMTGPLTLPGDPTADNHAARKAYVDAITNHLAGIAVTSVGATSPLESSGGATPDISLSGVISNANIADDITISPSGSVAGAAITDGSVTSGKLAAGAVVSAGITDGAVTAAKIQDGAVTSNKLDASVDARYLCKDTTSSQTMAGALTVPAMEITGTNNWYVGNNSATVDLVMVSNGGEIKSPYDLRLRAPNGEIQFKSPVKFEAGINEAGKAGQTNNVATSGTGLTISVPGCLPASVVLITPTTNSMLAGFWVVAATNTFTVKSTDTNIWSFNYLVR